jgi:hypothetical protein
MISKHRRLHGSPIVLTASGVLLFLLIFFQPLVIHAEQRKVSDPDNPHNLSNTSSGIHAGPFETDQICIFCHAPHNSSAAGPLWNRPEITTALGGGAFPLYGHLDQIVIDDTPAAKYGGTNTYPNGSTRLCLSCHDGVTAVGTVISAWGGGEIAPSLGAMTTMVVDLSTSHPISFVYNDPDVMTAVNTKTQNDAGTLTVIPGQYKLPALDILDADGRMQCTTCHDPHIDTYEGPTGYTLPMWRHYTGNDGADYDDTCGECHIGGAGSTGLFQDSLTKDQLHTIP